VVTTPGEQDHPIDTLNALNNDFFDLEPWSYLHTRLCGLAAAAGKPDRFIDLFEVAFTVGDGFKIGGGGQSPAPEAVQRFAAVDSEVLLHHAAETVLRAYLTFASHPDAPWLDIAAQRQAREFKEKVRRRFRAKPVTSHDLDQTAVLLLGGEEPPEDETSYEDWRRATMNIESFLREFANHWLDEAHTYNSLKHGLVARSGEHSIRIEAAEGGSAVFELEGVTLAVVESERRDDKSIEWFLATKWIDVERNLALVWIATRLLRAAWAIAGVSYGHASPDPVELWYPVDLTPDHLKRKDAHAVRLRRSLIIQVPNRRSKP
jgi:hypothetical protein